MKQIQKKSIQSFLVIGLGFLLGAVNMLILFPKNLSKPEIGLTRLILDIGAVFGTLATFGAIPAIYKFYPFYQGHLKTKENDLPMLSALFAFGGSITISLLIVLFKVPIEGMFKERSALFIPYFYSLIPFVFFYTSFVFLEAFAWGTGKMVFSNFLKETFTRLYTTVLIILVIIKVITFPVFMLLFVCMYLFPSLALFFSFKKDNQFPINFTISKVTRRLGSKMMAFGAFIFFSGLLNIIARTIDSILIASLKDIGDMAIFAIASYFANLLDIPQRSITSVTVPILADHWRNKRIAQIESIYRKSALELLIIGVFIAGCLIINIKNITLFLPKGYESIAIPILILLAAKVVDLGTGINNQVIGTSNFWKFDFLTNVVYTIFSVPLNFFLIKKYGINGAAIANLIAIIIYNSIRFIFIKRKFGMQPFTIKSIVVILIGVSLIIGIHFIPFIKNLYLDSLIRTPIFAFLFVGTILLLKISDETAQVVFKAISFLKVKQKHD